MTVEAKRTKSNPATVTLTPFKKLGRDGKLARIKDLQRALPPLKELTGQQDIGVTDESTTDGYNKYRGVLVDAEDMVIASGDVTPRRLQEKHHVGRHSVLRWLDGRQPAFLARLIEGGTIIPFEEDTEFAFFLGHVIGQKEDLPEERLHVSNADEQVVERLRDEVDRIVSKKPSKKKRGKSYGFKLFCTKLLRYLNETTEGKTQLPWEHVKTRDERIAFLQGFFNTRTGDVERVKKDGLIYPRFLFSRKIPNVPKGEEPRFFVEMQILLMKLGITSTLYKSNTDKWYLNVNELSSQQRILDLKLLPDKKHKKLAGYVTEGIKRGMAPDIKRKKGSYTPEQYDAVMKYKDEYSEYKKMIEVGQTPGWRSPTAFFKDVAKKVNKEMRREKEAGNVSVTHELDRDIVLTWLKKGRKPQSPKNRDAIVEKEKKLYENKSVDDIPREPKKLRQVVEKLEKRIWQDIDERGYVRSYEDLEKIVGRICRSIWGTKKQFMGMLYESMREHQKQKGYEDEPEFNLLFIGMEEYLGIEPDLDSWMRQHGGSED